MLVAALGCLALVASERAANAVGTRIAKLLASSTFVAAALHAGALGSSFGNLVLSALVLSWLGDILLIPKGSKAPLLAGMTSFLGAHIAYALAFWFHGVRFWTAMPAVLLMAALSLCVYGWLAAHLSGFFRIAVPVYLAAIALMVALALSASAASHRFDLATGALLFAASDLLVARDRFVRPGWMNRAWGLPLYYAAQLVLAGSVEP
jgi:uncharacterized membrane protein YhhN